jgi:uncharacterized membrane protein
VEIKQRRVAAAHGWRWIVEAFRIFRRGPLIWLLLNTLLLLIGSALMLIPRLGPVVFALLTPVFMAGFVVACRDADHGGSVEVAHLFAGFRQNATPLITVGGVYLVGQLIVGGVMLFLGGDELRTVAAAAMHERAGAEPMPTDRLYFALLVGAALFTPLAMAVWFAPPLVVLRGAAPFAAMKASIRACLDNLLPMLVYGLGLAGSLFAVLFVLRAVFSLLPPGTMLLREVAAIGTFLAWVTLTLISVYTGYRDVFADDV